MSDFETDEEYYTYLEAAGLLPWQDDEFGPYAEEEYTGRPVPDSSTSVGATHHPACEYIGTDDAQWGCCQALWEADYETKKEQEAEELHEEWWQ